MASGDQDVVVALRVPAPSLKDRVQRKREILQKWLDNGIPHDKLASLPRSLTQARTWEDLELGIYPIGSPNSFTTQHPDVGRHVEVIAALLTKLKSKTKRPAATRAKSDPRKATISAAQVEQALSAMASQWHIAREQARRERKRAEILEGHLEVARSECRAKDEELAELRRRLSDGLSVVK